MGLNDTPTAERVHIGLFGKRNAGKSSLINAITNQEIAIVSKVKGTTTDPVYKTMELLPIGPVVLIDTPGLDDESELGQKRVKKSYDVLKKTDVAIIVASKTANCLEDELKFMEECKHKEIPCVLVINKIDQKGQAVKIPTGIESIEVSAKAKLNIDALKEKLIALAKNDADRRPLVGDLVGEQEVIVLVVPIDKAAPKGRLILPQQQAIRDILDHRGICVVTQENSLKKTLSELKSPPKLVITDSQVFEEVANTIPKDLPLTSFSILFARKKGILETSIKGVKALRDLKDDDRILICEGCTHHRQCNDIGSVKIPNLIKKHTGVNPCFEFTSGIGFKDDLSGYKLVVHCGGCMLSQKEMENRKNQALRQNVAFTNYGILIARLKGILDRATAPLDLN